MLGLNAEATYEIMAQVSLISNLKVMETMHRAGFRNDDRAIGCSNVKAEKLNGFETWNTFVQLYERHVLFHLNNSTY